MLLRLFFAQNPLLNRYNYSTFHSILIILKISLSSVWQDLVAFVKNPRLDPLPGTFLERPWKVFPYLLAIDFLLMIPLSGIIGLAGVEEMDHKIIEMLDQPLVLFFMAVILAPIFEELFFRFPIGNWWKLPVMLFGGNETEWSIITWWKKHFKTIFWLFTVFFAAVHLANFGAKIPFYLMPLLVLPQFILGIMLGYIRVGWGFRYGVLFHALHNGILLSIATLAEEFGGGM